MDLTNRNKEKQNKNKEKITVFNFSKYKLNTSEIQILKRGLKFVPTPEMTSTIKETADIATFTRKVKLWEYFLNKTDNRQEDMFSNKSKFTPPKSNDITFNNIINNLQNIGNKNIKTNSKPKFNINLKERISLNKLKDNDKLIIQKADKGSATIIMDKMDYERGILDILSDKNTYMVTEPYDLKTLSKKVNEVMSMLKNNNAINKNEFDYLTNFHMKPATIYGLPKIHKSKNLNEKLKDYSSNTHPNEHTTNFTQGIFHGPFNEYKIPFRQILSGTKCPISRICELAKKLLRPFELLIPHLVIDSFHFLNLLPKQTDKNNILVAIDVVQLYPSITNELGIDALKYWIRKHPEKVKTNFTPNTILDIISFIQDNVYFTFLDTTYKQTEGTSMGKNHAPQYANLVIAYLIITKLLPNIESKYGLVAKEHIKENLLFFLDDGFTLLNEDIISSDNLLIELNSINSHIKFTMDKDPCQIAFLDVLVIKHETQIETDIHFKETETFNYYPFNSSGPRHISRNIPMNLAKRICTIVSTEKQRNFRLEQLKVRLLEQKYPLKLIDNSIKIAKQLNRDDLLKITRNKEGKEHENIITLVSDYNPNTHEKFTNIKQLLDNLQITEKVQSLSKNTNKEPKIIIPRIINAKRQPKNLQRIFNTNKSKPIRTYNKCTNKRCLTCKQVIDKDTYTTKNGTTLKRNEKMNCKSQDLIYCLICPTCKEEYIGETGIPLHKRMNLHRNQIEIEEYRNLPCSKHLYTCGKTKFKIFPFFKCKSNNNIFRHAAEKHFQDIVHPLLH